jgi:hypothetical protein
MINNIRIQIRELRLYINLPLLKIDIILRLYTITPTFFTHNLNYRDLPSFNRSPNIIDSTEIDSANRLNNLSKWERR